MKARILIMISSLIISMAFIAAGYGLWEEVLTVKGHITVIRPEDTISRTVLKEEILTPGAIGVTPGAIDTTPGAIDTTPGAIDTTPGVIDTTPGAIGTIPGTIGTVPGTIGTVPDVTGKEPSGGITDKLPEGSNASNDVDSTTDNGVGTNDINAGSSSTEAVVKDNTGTQGNTVTQDNAGMQDNADTQGNTVMQDNADTVKPAVSGNAQGASEHAE